MRITVLLLLLFFYSTRVYSQDTNIAGLTGGLSLMKDAIVEENLVRRVVTDSIISADIYYPRGFNIDKILSPEQLNTTQYVTIPEKRWGHQLAYDEANGRVLLFGGSHGDTVLRDLWAWNGSHWNELTQDGTPMVNKGVFVYDAGRKTSVLFGGANGKGVNMGGTWEWDGKTWKGINIKGPVARVHASGVYDRKNKRVLIFGGFGSPGSLNDTWAFDGNTWQQLNTDGPAERVPLAMTYDETKEAVVLITRMLKPDPLSSGLKNEMWRWTETGWNNLHVTVPAFTDLQALTSLGKNEILLYDGNDGTTWKYKSGQWQAVSKSGPGIRTGHTMVYDKKRMKVVLFGGGKRDTDIRYNDTWEWDGKNWTEIK